MNPYWVWYRWWNGKSPKEKHWFLFKYWRDLGSGGMMFLYCTWRYLDSPWYTYLLLFTWIVVCIWKGLDHEEYVERYLGLVPKRRVKE